MAKYQSKSDSLKPTRVRSVDTGEDVGYTPLGQVEFATITDQQGNKEMWVGTPSPDVPVEETPSSTSAYSKPAIPMDTSPEGTVQRKYEAQEAMAYANFQQRMLNAGASIDPKTGQTNLAAADEILVAYANAGFQNDIADLQTWRRTIKGRMAMIDKKQYLSSEMKEAFRLNVLRETKDAIYIPDITSAQMNKKPKPLFSDKEVLKAAGAMQAKFGETKYAQDIYDEGAKHLGIDWETRFPELKTQVDQMIQNKDSSGGTEMIRVKDSDGRIARIPKSKLSAAKKQDPNLKVL
jgi:hypothetical protein